MSFSGLSINKIERGRSSLENTGTRLEEEFIGAVNSNRYKELAYSYLHRNEAPKADETPDEKFERMIRMRESARKEFEDALDLADRDKYIDYKNSVRLVEQSQFGDPENPSKFFSKALYDHIKNRFDDKYLLKFFTATGGTHLDVVHGVDGFFKLYDGASGQELAMATIDLTKNTMKDKARADVLININQEDIDRLDPSRSNENFDKEFFDNKINSVSEEIIEALIENYQSRGRLN